MLINNEEHSDLCVGIDLGTTNSVLATINIKQNGDLVSKVVDIPRAVDAYSSVTSAPKLSNRKKPTLPSCVYYQEDNKYEPIVGDFAKMQYSLRPHLVAKSVKSQMGNSKVEGLQSEVPDKTPAEVSSKILKHMIKQAEKIYRVPINDAVITVPANFDSIMCKATIEAAALAGIRVRDSDGSERPLLLSEPNAVIYDLINQINNGEISSHILDLSSEKYVMVFDLGGGTLDITMHTIKRREDYPDVLKVDEVATNRYTLLGGDDFDEAIAKEMFKRHLMQYSKYPDVMVKLQANKDIIMPQLRVYAEDLKIEINERYQNGGMSDDGWGDEDEFSVGGNMGGIGFAYDDTFTQKEIEDILEPFMGNSLKFSDYTRVKTISRTKSKTHNIVFPILDVLSKAADSLKAEQGKTVVPHVDAVIVNGGMSKFYMVVERLRDFFGMDPIVALDPDQSVARGAAVYHYYLHKYGEIQDDMRVLGEDFVDVANAVGDKAVQDTAKADGTMQNKPVPMRSGIELGRTILNDGLYLGIRSGNVQEIVPTGSALPFTSDTMTGFKLATGQSVVQIPIKQAGDDTYKTIATGAIRFNHKYPDGIYVSIKVSLSKNKVLTMYAWTSKKENGENLVEQGIVTINVGDTSNMNALFPKSSFGAKITAPSGSKLNADDEVHNLVQLCSNIRRLTKARSSSSGKLEYNKNVKRLRQLKIQIARCGNKEDFEQPILSAMTNYSSDKCLMESLIVLSRKLCSSWSESGRSRLAVICENNIKPLILGYDLSKDRSMKNVNIQSIYTLGECGTRNQVLWLEPLENSSENCYVVACYTAYSHNKIKVGKVYKKFKKMVKGSSVNKASTEYDSWAYILGRSIADLKDKQLEEQGVNREDVINTLLGHVNGMKLNSNQLRTTIVAIGLACDLRIADINISQELLGKVSYVLDTLPSMYNEKNMKFCKRAISVVKKLISGQVITKEDEELLLMRIEDAEMDEEETAV